MGWWSEESSPKDWSLLTKIEGEWGCTGIFFHTKTQGVVGVGTGNFFDAKTNY